MRAGTKVDVGNMILARQKAWETSKKRELKLANVDLAAHAESPYDFYSEKAPPESSSRQWSQHYIDRLPWIKEQFDYMQQHSDEPILQRIKHAFDPVRANNPDINIGILADMCAAAVFLHLSYSIIPIR